MSLNFSLFLETEASPGSVAETLLAPGPAVDASTGAYRGRWAVTSTCLSLKGARGPGTRS